MEKQLDIEGSDVTEHSQRNEENIDVAQLLHEIWLQRWFVVGGAVCVAALAACAAWFVSRYQSEGLYQLVAPSVRTFEGQGLTPAERERDRERHGATLVVGQPVFADYKRVTTAIAERERLAAYLNARGLLNDEDFANLPLEIAKPDGVSRLIEPQYTISKADAKELADFNTKENATQLMGIRIKPTAQSPEVAQKINRVIADYVRDTTFQYALVEYMRSRETDLGQSLLLSDNQLIAHRFMLNQLDQKQNELTQIKGRYPGGERSGAGSVVSLSESTVRYLPLPAQQIAVETSAIDIKQTIERIQRERDQMAFLKQYYGQLRAQAETAPSAESIIKAMTGVRSSLAKSVDLNDDKFKQAVLTAEVEANRISDAYFVRSRYISGPTLPTTRNARLGLTVALAFIVGGFLAAFAALMRAWFSKNRSTIFG